MTVSASSARPSAAPRTRAPTPLANLKGLAEGDTVAVPAAVGIAAGAMRLSHLRFSH
jgi:hypothetical protein